jgi:hypothetical protein
LYNIPKPICDIYKCIQIAIKNIEKTKNATTLNTLADLLEKCADSWYKIYLEKKEEEEKRIERNLRCGLFNNDDENDSIKENAFVLRISILDAKYGYASELACDARKEADLVYQVEKEASINRIVKQIEESKTLNERSKAMIKYSYILKEIALDEAKRFNRMVSIYGNDSDILIDYQEQLCIALKKYKEVQRALHV